MEKYDAIVIGSGPAGNSAAYGLKEQGKKWRLSNPTCGAGLVRTVGVIQRKC